MYKWRFMQNHIFMFYLVEIADSVLLDSFEWSESVWVLYIFSHIMRIFLRFYVFKVAVNAWNYAANAMKLNICM